MTEDVRAIRCRMDFFCGEKDKALSFERDVGGWLAEMKSGHDGDGGG